MARASRAGHAEALAALLEAPGVDVNLGNDKMQCPLHFAVNLTLTLTLALTTDPDPDH